MRSPRTTTPLLSTSGLVAVTRPSARAGSGAVEERADEPGPRGGRAHNAGPVRRPVVDDLHVLGDQRVLVAAHKAWIEVVEQARDRGRRDRDPRAALLAELEHAVLVPGRDE